MSYEGVSESKPTYKFEWKEDYAPTFEARLQELERFGIEARLKALEEKMEAMETRTATSTGNIGDLGRIMDKEIHMAELLQDRYLNATDEMFTDKALIEALEAKVKDLQAHIQELEDQVDDLQFGRE